MYLNYTVNELADTYMDQSGLPFTNVKKLRTRSFLLTSVKRNPVHRDSGTTRDFQPQNRFGWFTDALCDPEAFSGNRPPNCGLLWIKREYPQDHLYQPDRKD